MTTLTFSTFSAWVSIDGEKAGVYAVDASEANRVTGWIASEVDKPFSITWKDSVLSFPTAGQIIIDGELLGSKQLYKEHHVNNPTGRWGKRISANEQRPYTFARLAATDNDSVSNTLPPGIGEIKLELYQATIRKQNDQPLSYSDTPREVSFHEKDKKRFDHHVTFGAPVKSHASYDDKLSVHRIGQPIVTFCFKYRPLATLQAEGIAPLPPQVPKSRAPKREERASRLTSLQEDDAEALEIRVSVLQAELNEIQARLAAIKKRARPSGHLEVESKENLKRVKREFTAVPGEIEVIDLT